jgi:putative acetyltransferase
MGDPALRDAGPEDKEFAFRTRQIAFRGYLEQAQGWDEAEQRRLHERRFAAQRMRIMVADGADVGFVATSLRSEWLQLNQLFILPDHQGRGIGRWCVRKVQDEARALGLPVRLRVLKVNPRAKAFYERLGFVRTGEEGVHVHMEWR